MSDCIVNIIANRKEDAMFYFALIDIMFLPYLFHLPIKLSMITLMWWLVKKKRLTSRFLYPLLAFVFIGGLSICIGLLKQTVETSIIFTNVQTLVIIVYGYLVYEYFKNSDVRSINKLNSFLLAYLGLACAFMALYWFSPQVFFKIRPFWTLQRTGEVFRGYSLNRFTFIVSEPNNFAALVVGIMGFLLFSDKLRWNESLIVVVASLCLVMSTSSISGTASFFLVITCYVLFHKRKKRERIKTSTVRKILMSCGTIAVLGFAVYVVMNVKDIMGLDILKSATGRYDLYFTEDSADFSGDRMRIWKYYIENNNLLTHLLVGDGSVNKPHSGHLYLIYSYGLVMYIVFLKIFFFGFSKDKKAIIVRAVFAIVFTMNTFIVDLRSFTLYAVLLAVTSRFVTDKLSESNQIIVTDHDREYVMTK